MRYYTDPEQDLRRIVMRILPVAELHRIASGDSREKNWFHAVGEIYRRKNGRMHIDAIERTYKTVNGL